MCYRGPVKMYERLVENLSRCFNFKLKQIKASKVVTISLSLKRCGISLFIEMTTYTLIFTFHTF